MSAYAIASALVRWRREHADLIPLGATFHVITDAAAQETCPLKSVISVFVGPSDGRAVVPFTVREDISCSEVSRLPLFLDRLERAVSGKRVAVADGTSYVHVHRLSRVATTIDDGAGLSVKASIQWEGAASWR